MKTNPEDSLKLIDEILGANENFPFDVLNLSPDATAEEIKKRYRQLSMIFHPDKREKLTLGISDEAKKATIAKKAEEVFKKISTAYEKFHIGREGEEQQEIAEQKRRHLLSKQRGSVNPAYSPPQSPYRANPTQQYHQQPKPAAPQQAQPKSYFSQSTLEKKLFEARSTEEIFNLLRNGADINARNDKGQTILHVIAKDDNRAHFIPQLIRWGANIEAQDKKGYTPIHYAADYGSIKSTMALKSAGANLNAKGGPHRDTTALHLATQRGDDKIVSALSRGSDVNYADRRGYGAVHHAVRFGGSIYGNASKVENMFADLFAAGASFKRPSNQGHLPGDLAKIIGNMMVINLLNHFIKHEATKAFPSFAPQYTKANTPFYQTGVKTY